MINDRENGVLVAVGDTQAIADAIEMVATDAELQQTLSENAKRHAVSAFDIRVMLDAYEQVYDGLIAARNERSVANL